MLNLSLAKDTDDQVARIYQTLLSRRPSSVERAAWEKARQAGLDGPEDLIFALINT